MEKIRLDITKALSFLDPGTMEAYAPQVAAAQTALEQGTCPGNDFLGWLHLPSSITPEFLNEVQAVADTLRSQCDYVVVAGIGGSYLGARAIIEALGNSFSWLVRDDRNPVILFAGNNIGEDYLYELTTYLKGKRFGVINISKSGTTTETALTFRLLKKQCEAERGKEAAKDVIVTITDAHKGAARAAADKEGYKTFVIPDNVGGRFSVLTPVGLLPIAVAGFDIRQLVARPGHGEGHRTGRALLRQYRGAVCSRAQRALPEGGQEDRDHGQLPAEAPFRGRVVEAALWRERGQGS